MLINSNRMTAEIFNNRTSASAGLIYHNPGQKTMDGTFAEDL